MDRDNRLATPEERISELEQRHKEVQEISQTEMNNMKQKLKDMECRVMSNYHSKVT